MIALLRVTYTAPNCDLSSLSEDDAAEFRNREIGFVWQFHYLLPEFTALENVAMPLLLRGSAGRRRREKLRDGCTRWDWSSAPTTVRANFPAASSSAWLWPGRSSPSRKVLLADEPTGDLDGRTAESVFELIARLHRDYQLTSLIATHNLGFRAPLPSGVALQRGRIEEVAPESLAGVGNDGD